MLHNFYFANYDAAHRLSFSYVSLGLKWKVAKLTANGGSGGLGLGWTKSTGCKVCCVCGGVPLLRKLRFSGAGVSSLCGVKAGVSGGVCVGLCEPGSGLPSSESFRLLVRFLVVVSDSGTPDAIDTVTFATSSGNFFCEEFNRSIDWSNWNIEIRSYRSRAVLRSLSSIISF